MSSLPIPVLGAGVSREAKQRLLDVFDSLIRVANERVHRNERPRSGKSAGGYFACGVCDGLQSSAEQHKPGCVVGRLLAEVTGSIPAHADRAEWLEST